MAETFDSTALRTRVSGLGIRAAHLQGRKQADELRQAELIQDVADAKGRMSLAPEVGSVFEGLQNAAHQRSVGSLQDLLTAIVNDVLPAEGSVKLVPSYKANSTHLDILLEKGGYSEDILEANGGALTNVVCAGLRFAALARLTHAGNRRLLVLDEPDCWLKTERVPAFAQTLSQVAKQGEFQSLVITHKHQSNFEGHCNLVRFSANDDGKVECTVLSPQVSQWESDEQPGLRKIELFNVRRHVHTVVPCFPGATVYLGDNNLGKSTALAGALKIVGYGESDDSVFRHGTDEARIVLHLERNQRIEWVRRAKGSPAVLYRHYVGDEMVAEGRPKSRNQAPEWVEDVLGIRRVEDLDIQVGNQKSPVFLLDDPAPRRAQILSVGRESSHLPGLMRAYEQLKASDRELIKQGETELSRLKLRLTFSQRVPDLSARHGELSVRADEILRSLESRERMERAVAKLEALTESTARAALTVRALEALPALPVLEDVGSLKSMIDNLTRKSRVSNIPALPGLPTAPALHDLEKITTIGQRLAKARKTLAVAEGVSLSLPEAPALENVSQLHSSIEKLVRQAQRVGESTNALRTITHEHAAAAKAHNDLIDELGGCPLCGGVMDHEHAEESEHAA